MMKQKKYLVFAILLLINFGCVNSNNEEVKKEKDSLIGKKQQEEINSLIAEAGDRSDSEQDPPSLREERNKFIKSYNRVVSIDTLIIDGNDSLNLRLKYHCQKDRNLLIPKKYVFEEKEPKDFLTHPFVCDVKVFRGRKIIFERTIEKTDFDHILTDQLREYAILSKPYSPRYDKETGNIIMDYSISIPVTDLGIGVQLKINKNGTFTVARN